MKKTIFALLALCCLLTGCFAGKPASDTPTQTSAIQPSAETTAPATSAPTTPPNVVTPLASTIDLDHLDHCTVSVALSEGDAYLDDSGKMQMRILVYDHEYFDMAALSQLAVGDIIVLHGDAVTVSQLDRTESGAIHINGGLDNGGYTLLSTEDTVYYESGYNDHPYYLEVGFATVPVSQDFLFTDSSDLDAGTVTFYPGDFLVEDPGIRYPFHPYNTTITIENGEIIAMNRVYTP